MPYFSSLQQFLDTVTARLTKPKRGVGGSEGVLATDVLEALKDTGKYTDDMRVVAQNAISTFNAVYDPALNAANQAALSAAAANALVTGVSTNRPSIRPSLLLDFANARALDPRITFSRAGATASYFNARGARQNAGANQPRFHFDPATGRCRGLLLESQAKNYAAYSADLTNAWWSKARVTVLGGQTVGEIGNANKIIPASISGDHAVYNNIISTGSTTAKTITLSAIAAKGEMSRITLVLGNGNFGPGSSQLYDLNTGAKVGSIFGGGLVNPSSGMSLRADGRYDIWLTGTTDGANQNITAGVYVYNSAGQATYIGNDSDGLYVWEVEVKDGDFSTPVPTTGVSVTRGEDLFSITGTNFSEWFNPAEGTLYMEVEYLGGVYGPATTTNPLVLDDSTANNTMSIRCARSLSDPRLDVVQKNDGVVTVDTLGKASITTGTVYRRVVAWKKNDFMHYIDGVLVESVSTFSVPVGLNRVTLTATHGLILSRLAYYPKRLSNSECIALGSNGLLAGRAPNQLPTAGDLGSAAFESLPSLLMRPNRQEFQVEGTGSSRTITIRRPYDFTFVLVDATGSTVTAQPSTTCAANTNYSLTFNAPAGTLLTYSITPNFYA